MEIIGQAVEPVYLAEMRMQIGEVSGFGSHGSVMDWDVCRVLNVLDGELIYRNGDILATMVANVYI
jgi:hypothetical protein